MSAGWPLHLVCVLIITDLTLSFRDDAVKYPIFSRLFPSQVVGSADRYSLPEYLPSPQDSRQSLYPVGQERNEPDVRYHPIQQQRYERGQPEPDQYEEVAPAAENYQPSGAAPYEYRAARSDDDWTRAGGLEDQGVYGRGKDADDWPDDAVKIREPWAENYVPQDDRSDLESRNNGWPDRDGRSNGWVAPSKVRHENELSLENQPNYLFGFGQNDQDWSGNGGADFTDAGTDMEGWSGPQSDWPKNAQIPERKSHLLWNQVPKSLNAISDKTESDHPNNNVEKDANDRDASSNERRRDDAPADSQGTAQRLDAIRQAFLHQPSHEADSESFRALPSTVAEGSRVQEAKQVPVAAPLRLRKRVAASEGVRSGYMPWLMITSIAVGTVGTVLAAIFVVRRFKGEPGKVVTQQWIPHHVLRMSTGSADIQPAGTKGLLERRCSSSSLTIHLQNSDDDADPTATSSERQCDAAEYLASAGNRLSRRELRQTTDSVASLQAEFWDVPLNFPDKCDIVGASTKNRYKTVIPNEPTRVTLPGVNEDPLSCYINANWIRGYDSEERAYIATQGPLAHTLDDFWEMVLSKRAPAIVMITKLRENGRIKCAGYLPETRQKATFGKIEVTVKRILPRNGYTLRHLTVKRGKEVLQLQHFWFTAWPDHRTPEDSQQLLQMAAEVEAARRDAEGNPTGPVVVHCSAGIGRTGCFVAISIGTSQLMEEGGVDVLGIVCSMRQDRGGMVQTAEQYIFIHRALRDFEASLPTIEIVERRSH